MSDSTDIENLKKTPFCEMHKQSGAKMVPFGGWYMPVQYTGIVEEHNHVRTSCGVFDVSHMGEVRVKGENAEKFVQNLVTNDVSKMTEDQCLYTPMLYQNAGIVDDLLVYKLANDHFMLVINASNIDKDFKWMNENSLGVELTNVSDETAELAIQGPDAQKALQEVTEQDLSEIKFFNFKQIEIAGITSIVSRTGYTGEDGFEVYFNPKDAETMWKKLFEKGSELGLKPIGLGARDTLRLEAGLMLYGNDIDENVTPFEAPLKWTVKMDTEFIGKKALEEKEKKRKLTGFELLERAIPRHGNEIYINGEKFDLVTSGTFSPTLKKPIGFGFVPKDLEKRSEIEIKIRDKMVKAKTCSHRFYKRK